MADQSRDNKNIDDLRGTQPSPSKDDQPSPEPAPDEDSRGNFDQSQLGNQPVTPPPSPAPATPSQSQGPNAPTSAPSGAFDQSQIGKPLDPHAGQRPVESPNQSANPAGEQGATGESAAAKSDPVGGVASPLSETAGRPEAAEPTGTSGSPQGSEPEGESKPNDKNSDQEPTESQSLAEANQQSPTKGGDEDSGDKGGKSGGQQLEKAAEKGLAATGPEGKVAAEALKHKEKLAPLMLLNPLNWSGFLALALSVLVFALVTGIAGSGGGSSAQADPGGGVVPGLADISDVDIKQGACGFGSAPGGCYTLPDMPKYWTSYGGTGNHTGTKCLAQLIAATSKAWKEKHPDDTIFIGDMNADGHLSHQVGVDVDLHTSKAANMHLPGYSAQLSIEYGKLWMSSGAIVYIFFNDASVRGPVNNYAKENGFPGVMDPEDGHEDHFHVRIKTNGGECPKGGAAS